MKISGLVISILLVGLIVVSTYSFMASLAEPGHYNVTLPETNYSSIYNRIDNISDSTERTQARILNITAKEDKGFFTGTWDTFLIVRDVTIGAVGSVGDSIGIGADLLTTISSDLGISDTVFSVLITLLTLGIIGALIFLIVKRQW